MWFSLFRVEVRLGQVMRNSGDTTIRLLVHTIILFIQDCTKILVIFFINLSSLKSPSPFSLKISFIIVIPTEWPTNGILAQKIFLLHLLKTDCFVFLF